MTRSIDRAADPGRRCAELPRGIAARIRETGRATTGSLVRKGEVLASYYTPEINAPQQTYLSTLATYERVKQTGVNSFDNLQGGTQLQAYEKNVRTLRQSLLNLGMTVEQLEEIERGHEVAPLMQIRAPAGGFVVSFRCGGEMNGAVPTEVLSEPLRDLLEGLGAVAIEFSFDG